MPPPLPDVATTQVRAPSRRERLTRPLLTGAAVVAATVALRLRDPHTEGSWGLCPFKALTGLDCPGCGSLRAVNDLTHGDVVAALSSNLLVTLALPFVVAGWLLWVRRSWSGAPRPERRSLHPAAFAVLLVLTVAFTVARNTAWGAWLHS